MIRRHRTDVPVFRRAPGNGALLDGGPYDSEWSVRDDAGDHRGWVARDGYRDDGSPRWLAFTAAGYLLAEIDMETRAEAAAVVLHPERVTGEPMR